MNKPLPPIPDDPYVEIGKESLLGSISRGFLYLALVVLAIAIAIRL